MCLWNIHVLQYLRVHGVSKVHSVGDWQKSASQGSLPDISLPDLVHLVFALPQLKHWIHHYFKAIKSVQ